MRPSNWTPSSCVSRPAALAEVARLRAELEHMTRQRDILKKAMAIVSQEQRSGSK